MASKLSGGRACIIDGCELITPPRSQLPICSNCRATIHRWDKRRTSEIDHRKQFLLKSQDRMGQVSGARRRGR